MSEIYTKVCLPSPGAASYDFHYAQVKAITEVLEKYISMDDEMESLMKEIRDLKKRREQLIAEEKGFIGEILRIQRNCGHSFIDFSKSKITENDKIELGRITSGYNVNLPSEYTNAKMCIHCFGFVYKSFTEVMFPKCHLCWGEMVLESPPNNKGFKYPAGSYRCSSCGERHTLRRDYL
ncbi:MAG: hypothetical protein RLY61_948 [Candidatus Parcubacteria bacterium]|jgi:hypothetical protein